MASLWVIYGEKQILRKLIRKSSLMLLWWFECEKVDLKAEIKISEKCTLFVWSTVQICAHTILTLCIGNCNITNKSTKILFSYLWPLDPPPDQVLCALVCKDLSHGQPDVHLSWMVEKLLTLGGKDEGEKGMDEEGKKGEKEKGRKKCGGHYLNTQTNNEVVLKCITVKVSI